ncbi:jasmonate-induced oxygenase 2-like [Mercurialis annua]|uniref:jasmonate-induced oxygenase 2-like n=1 Tax=Mercurialis annua TaxID=3986 RepID=UPI002160F05B|nr:jasmonate-induced oxygenase 2-like [Mercurialis annua]
MIQPIIMSKYVQEMSIDGDEPPPRFIIKQIPNPNPPLTSIPIIDLSLLSSSSSPYSEQIQELQNLKEALSSWGCFQATGHGISCIFLDKIREVSKQFFGLATMEKQKYGRAVNDIEGYGNDPVLSDNQVYDWSDRLFLNLIPHHSRKLQLWPTNPTQFREILSEYSEKMKEMAELLLKAMARSLNLEENCFLKQYEKQEQMAARFNYYPKCPKPESVLGVKAHSDGSAITILLQDKQVEGLQIFKDDQWYKVPIIPHALLVNLGDQMQIMSNGILKSPIHRVSTSSEKNRISIAVFHLPNSEVEIEPIQDLVDEKRPQQYRKLTNYGAINFQCFQSGKIALDSVKI